VFSLLSVTCFKSLHFKETYLSLYTVRTLSNKKAVERHRHTSQPTDLNCFTTCVCFLTVQLVLLCTVNVETINSGDHMCWCSIKSTLGRPFVRMIRKEDQRQTLTFSDSLGWFCTEFLCSLWPTGFCAFRWDYQATSQLHDCN